MKFGGSVLFVLLAPPSQDVRIAGFVLVILGVPLMMTAALMFVHRNAGTTATHTLPGVYEQPVRIEHAGKWWLFIRTARFASWNFECSLVDPVTGVVAARHTRYSVLSRIASSRAPFGFFLVETPGEYLFRVRGLQSAKHEVEFFLVHESDSQGVGWMVLAAAGVVAVIVGLFLAF